MGNLLRCNIHDNNVSQVLPGADRYSDFPRALYTLHRKMASQHGYSDGANCPQSDEIARIALNGVTRMVIDIAHAFNRECVPDFDIETLAPSMAHIVRSAQQHVLVADDFKNPQWLLDFEELRKMLKYFNRRWSLAGSSVLSFRVQC